MAEKGEIVNGKNALKSIFSRSSDDLIFRNKLGQLCASYLGGVWTTVSYQQIHIIIQKSSGSDLPGIFRGGRLEEYIPSRPLTNDEHCKLWFVILNLPVCLSLGNNHSKREISVTDQGFVGQKDDKDPIVLIDYEYDCYYNRGFDLCHYCVEYCQHNDGKIWPFYEIKQNQWPSEEIQRLYVNTYIDEANKRAEIDRGDFAYLEYDFDRLAMYHYWKSEKLKYLNR